MSSTMHVTLVSMPWAIFNRPSIQLGCLKGFLSSRPERITVRACHPYLRVAEAMGSDTYHAISESNWAGEALYSGLLFPDHAEEAEKLFRREMAGRSCPDFAELTAVLEQEMTRWLDEQDLHGTDLLGFSVCFSQLLASLYAAQAVKGRYPDLAIVFGGSTCTAELGRSLLQAFSGIDFIVTGEGEQPLYELTRFLAGRGPFPAHSVLGWEDEDTATAETDATVRASEIRDLNTLPYPNFDDYFRELQEISLPFIPVLPLEFSRGCWWNRCAFCNLNLQWHRYRFKNHARMLAELVHMLQRHQCLDFTFTDNALPLREAERFFLDMAAFARDIHFFAEIRALKRLGTWQTFRNGGLRSVQVGIEALSDSLLTRMNKGVSVMENVAAMKFAQAAGMDLDGNLILEFPGSTEEEVRETLAVLAMVLPYRPLKAAGFFLGHGSPVCCRPGDYGISATFHHPANRRLFPAEILGRLDLLIKSYRGDRGLQARRWQPVRRQLRAWQEFHRGRKDPSLPPLSYRDGGDFLIIRQEVPAGPVLHHRLRGLSRKIYLACEEPVSKKKLLHLFNRVKEEQLNDFLAGLRNKRLLFTDDTSCLALAVRQR